MPWFMNDPLRDLGTFTHMHMELVFTGIMSLDQPLTQSQLAKSVMKWYYVFMVVLILLVNSLVSTVKHLEENVQSGFSLNMLARNMAQALSGVRTRLIVL